MPIKLIACDLDDTLLKEDLSISPRNRGALRSAAAQGIRIVLASGRNIHSMKAYARDLGLDGPGEYMICTNGAEILETATGRRIYEKSIDGPLCQEIVRAMAERDLAWQVYEDGFIHVSEAGPWSELDQKLTGQMVRVIPAAERQAFLAKGHVKFVVPGDAERIAEVLPELQALFAGRAELVISKPYFLEILPLGVDKGEALTRLCALLGIGLEDVLAMGDSMNDLGMLRLAGHSWAPANGRPEAQAAARRVSHLSHEEDAVAAIVEEYLGFTNSLAPLKKP